MTETAVEYEVQSRELKIRALASTIDFLKSQLEKYQRELDALMLESEAKE